MKRSSLKSKPKRRSEAERFHRARFREEVLAAGYCVEHGSECAGEIQDPMHIIKAQIIRAHLHRVPREEDWAIIFDPRIGVRGCRPFHRLIDGQSFRHGEHTYLRAEQIPWQAITYCQDHDLMGVLERAVPDLSAGQVDRG